MGLLSFLRTFWGFSGFLRFFGIFPETRTGLFRLIYPSVKTVKRRINKLLHLGMSPGQIFPHLPHGVQSLRESSFRYWSKVGVAVQLQSVGSFRDGKLFKFHRDLTR